MDAALSDSQPPEAGYCGWRARDVRRLQHRRCLFRAARTERLGRSRHRHRGIGGRGPQRLVCPAAPLDRARGTACARDRADGARLAMAAAGGHLAGRRADARPVELGTLRVGRSAERRTARHVHGLFQSAQAVAAPHGRDRAKGRDAVGDGGQVGQWRDHRGEPLALFLPAVETRADLGVRAVQAAHQADRARRCRLSRQRKFRHAQPLYQPGTHAEGGRCRAGRPDARLRQPADRRVAAYHRPLAQTPRDAVEPHPLEPQLATGLGDRLHGDARRDC